MRYALPDRYAAALSVAYGGGLAAALVLAACSPPFPTPDTVCTPPGSTPTAAAPTPPQAQP